MQVELGGGRQLPERRPTLDVPKEPPVNNGRESPTADTWLHTNGS